MSYCRFTESSDVYAYECDGGVQFWVADKADKGLDRQCSTFNEAYQYAKVLRDKYGLNVPDTAIEELRADAIEEVKRINGVIEELYDENAKLLEQIHWLKKGDVLHVLTDQELIDQQKHEREVQASITALDDENAKLRELITFYLGCLTKGHMNCDSCAFSGEDNCDHGRKVIESAKQVGIEVNG